MIPVYWIPATSRGSWDQTILEELTSGDGFVHDPVLSLKESGAVVVIAGQHLVASADIYADRIAQLAWALTIVTSDEEALFPVELLPHDDRHVIWGQYHARPEFDRVIPIGVPPGTAETLTNVPGNGRINSVVFMGQDTHARRHELMEVIKEMAPDVKRYGEIGWCATTGFRGGLSQELYLQTLKGARIAPCPSGPHSLDSFRLYEAIAAGALPIVERCTPHDGPSDFWVKMFGSNPLPIVNSWHELPALVEDYIDPEAWRLRRDEVQDWWRSYRAGLTLDFWLTIERIRES